MACPFAGSDFSRQGSPSNGNNPSHRQLNSDTGGVPTVLKPGADPISYHEYLQIDKLLSCQELRSAKYGKPAHDEMLFITTHQVYELWFKQILHEIGSVIALFAEETSAADESAMLKIIERLGRVVQILKMCVSHFNVLMTMTPMDFASFRDYLVPASGFQSVQFRLVENRLGLTTKNRIHYHRQDYKVALDYEHQEQVEKSEKDDSLLQCVEQWLERNPAMKDEWWEELSTNMKKHLEESRAEAEEQINPEMKQNIIDGCDAKEAALKQLFDVDIHEALLKKGNRKISHRALQSAYLINIFRDKPRFQIPFKVLQCLMDIDNEIIEWRHKHAGMVQRMIGNKMGTGGSSGYMYLRSTVSDRYKVFLDISTLSTFLMPHHVIPPLSDRVHKNLHHQPPTPGRKRKAKEL